MNPFMLIYPTPATTQLVQKRAYFEIFFAFEAAAINTNVEAKCQYLFEFFLRAIKAIKRITKLERVDGYQEELIENTYVPHLHGTSIDSAKRFHRSHPSHCGDALNQIQ